MTDAYDREALRWPRDRKPMTRIQTVIAFALFVRDVVRDWRKPRRMDATEHPLRSERIPVDRVRESGNMGVGEDDS
jgi:hypothetical protein